jgi:hypothetical protein
VFISISFTAIKPPWSVKPHHTWNWTVYTLIKLLCTCSHGYCVPVVMVYTSIMLLCTCSHGIYISHIIVYLRSRYIHQSCYCVPVVTVYTSITLLCTCSHGIYINHVIVYL